MKNDDKTIYVVSSHDYDGSHLTIGVWRKRGNAINKSTDFIIARMGLSRDFCYAFSNDINNPEMVGSVEYDCNNLVFVKPKKDVRDYVRDVLGGDGCYMIEDFGNLHRTFRFDIDECEIED